MPSRHCLAASLVGLLAACTGQPASTTGDSEPDVVTGTTTPDAVTTGATGTSTADLDDSGAPESPSTTGTSTADLDDSGADTSTATADTSTTDPVTLCGNGVIDPDEQCDDGNADPDDVCLPDCHLGPGGQGHLIPISLLPDEDATCFTVAGDGLAIAGKQFVKGDELELFAHVQQVPLPDGQPIGWSYHEAAGIHGRWPQRAATASNGDVIIGGLIYTQIKEVDSGGRLWLARFTAAGALVWTRETDTIARAVHDLALGPDDEIVIVGRYWGLGGSPPTVAAFTGAGEPVWTFEEPLTSGQSGEYTGVVLDDLGAVYVAGSREQMDDDHLFVTDQQLLLRALTPAGAPLWLTELPWDATVGLYPVDLALTVDDQLVLPVTTRDPNTHEALPQRTLAAFDTAGVALWSTAWQGPAPWSVGASKIVAAAGGGFYLAGGGSLGDAGSTFLARFASDGAPQWMKLAPGPTAIDALIGLDDQVYLLTQDAVVRHAP